MAQVTYQNLFSEPRNNVVALINSDVTDPLASSSKSRKWIYSRVPSVKSTKFAGYPLIVVSPTDLDIEEEMTSGEGKHKFVTFTIEIEILSSDNGYADNNGKGLTYLDSISDDLMTALMDTSNRNAFALNSMEMINPITDAVEVIEFHKEKIYRRTMTLPFKSRLAISA